MQYGRFRPTEIINLDLNAASIGELLEQEFEHQGIPTELPTTADWGYTFRAKVGKHYFDVSVVDHDEDGFGIALELPEDIISRLFNHNSKKAIEQAKTLVSESLATIAPGYTLFWYSKEEWLASFDAGFWQHVH